MQQAFSNFFRQIRTDFRTVFFSRYTYIVLGLIAYLGLINAVYLLAGWDYNGWLMGRNSTNCSAPSNGKILTAMFGSMLFAVFAIRGFGEAVRAMDFHYKKVVNAEFLAARKSAVWFLVVAGVLGLILVWVVTRMC